MNIGFFAKKEQLEQALACVYSLESLHRDIDITICVPSDAVQIYTLRFEHEDLKIISIEVPYLLHEFPFMDKLLAASIYEQAHKHFIWIDVDSYFLKPFTGFIKEHGILVNPVDIKNVGLSTDQKMSPYFETCLKQFNLETTTYQSNIFKTTITKESIYPYFNMGFVIIYDNKFIFKQALDAFYEVFNHPIISKLVSESYLYAIFLHQVLFSLSIIKSYFYDDIHVLPPYYNYPLHLIKKDATPPDINLLQHFRYDTFFNHVDEDILKLLPEYLRVNAHLLKQ